MRGPPKKRSKAPLLVILAVLVLAGAGAGAWWAVLREGAPYANLLSPAPETTTSQDTLASADAASTPERLKLPDWMRSAITRPGGASVPPAPGEATPPKSVREVPAASEALLIADPIDGPFFVTFKQLLPDDYTAMVAPLLTDVSDPQREHDRFDALLSSRLEAFQANNAKAIATAGTPVLAEMAINLQRAMRTPEICYTAMESTYQPLPLANAEARRIATASNLSLIRAVASGRAAAVTRVPPSPTQVRAFNKDLEKRLTAQQWTAFQSGEMGNLPVSDQCIIMAAYWSVIAGYPREEAAQWTAYQMGGLAAQ